ncbi:Uncharacterised protein [Mycolicibacterium smegmatis]|nr:Uncharacterised protein [Mycolicibacterium smegmatis]
MPTGNVKLHHVSVNDNPRRAACTVNAAATQNTKAPNPPITTPYTIPNAWSALTTEVSVTTDEAWAARRFVAVID